MTLTLNQTQRIVGVICKGRGRRVALRRVMKETSLAHKPTLRVCRKLERQGFLVFVREETEESRKGVRYNPKRFPIWKILDREKLCQSVECPGRNGRGQESDRIWKTIRMRGRAFCASDITTLSGCKRATVVAYIQLLAKHGLLNQKGQDRRGKYWRLKLFRPPVKRPHLSQVKTKNQR